MLCRTHGDVDVLEAGDLPEPQAGAGEVVISVRACGINFPDVQTLARRHGADEAIGYDDLRQQIAVLTNKRGVDVVFDPVGGELFEQALRSTAWQGRVLVIGFAAGDIPRIPMNLPLLKGLSIVGVFWGAFTEQEPALARANHLELLQLYVDGVLDVHIGARVEFARAAEALRLLASRQAMGKVVVTL
jgi:NADPH2:quinone reductase